MTSIEKTSIKTALVLAFSFYTLLAVALVFVPFGRSRRGEASQEAGPMRVEIEAAASGGNARAAAVQAGGTVPRAETARKGQFAGRPAQATRGGPAPATRSAAASKGQAARTRRSQSAGESKPREGAGRAPAFHDVSTAVAAGSQGRNAALRQRPGVTGAQPRPVVPRQTADSGGALGSAGGQGEAPHTSEAARSIGAMLAVIRSRVVEDRSYPAAAKRRGIQGRLTLEATVAADGSLTGVRIVQSSGSSILDEAGLQLLRKVFPVENPLLHSFSVIVPISYSLQG